MKHLQMKSLLLAGSMIAAISHYAQACDCKKQGTNELQTKAVPFNKSWENLRERTTETRERSAVLMNLSGALMKTQKGPQASYSILEPAQNPEALFEAVVQGGKTVEVWACQDDRCIDLQKKKITISPEQSLKAEIQKLLPQLREVSVAESRDGTREEWDIMGPLMVGLMTSARGITIDWDLALREENLDLLAYAVALTRVGFAQLESSQAYKALPPADQKLVSPWRMAEVIERFKALEGQVKAFEKKPTVTSFVTQKGGIEA